MLTENITEILMKHVVVNENDFHDESESETDYDVNLFTRFCHTINFIEFVSENKMTLRISSFEIMYVYQKHLN